MVNNTGSHIVMVSLCILSGIILSTAVPLAAQEFHQVTEITAHDIHSIEPGPQTTDVVMEGYRDRSTYHEMRYVSKGTGSDQTGDGTVNRPWASLSHALEQITDARLSRRYAILVGEGSYSEGEIFLKEYVHIYGGFSQGNWSRDIDSYATTIDGKGQSRLFTASDHSKIDGFVLIGGRVRGSGGALLCNGTSPVISNNRFMNNQSLGPEPWNPEFIHEIANDGGALAAINGARPVIFNNLFAGNSTENGRGGAIGAHNGAAPRIHYNVFLDNRSGTADPMRSSDGGAIAASYWSDADIFFNLIINNRSLSRNDGGGIFSEMWSSLHIVGNIVVGNVSDDDGGGLYLSGSVHHYITEHEAKVPAERYMNYVVGNILAGNRLSTGSGVAGAFRFTYFTRVHYNNNISYENTGGLDFRRTLVTARDNVVIEDVVVREGSEATLLSNRIYGVLDIDNEETLRTDGNRVAGIDTPDLFRIAQTQFKDDTHRLSVTSSSYDSATRTTILNIEGDVSNEPMIRNRVVKANDEWSVIKEASASVIVLWGDHRDVTRVTIYPSFSKK
jgi:hypothetical protein